MTPVTRNDYFLVYSTSLICQQFLTKLIVLYIWTPRTPCPLRPFSLFTPSPSPVPAPPLIPDLRFHNAAGPGLGALSPLSSLLISYSLMASKIIFCGWLWNIYSSNWDFIPNFIFIYPTTYSIAHISINISNRWMRKKENDSKLDIKRI